MELDDLIAEANLGIPEAQYSVAMCLQNGWGIETDQVAAMDWFLKSAKQGHGASQYELCLALQKDSNNPHREAIEWLRKSAESRFAPAAYLYSLYSEGGIGIPVCKTTAFRFGLAAAECGHSIAARRTASMYEQGIGVEDNLERAFFWYQKAAELGDADAAATVGKMYAQGIGVKADQALAMKWLQEGRKRGSPWACFTLSSIFRSGELGKVVDLKIADKFAKLGELLLQNRAD